MSPMDELEEFHIQESYKEYLRPHPAHDHALIRVLSWINTQEDKMLSKGDLYDAVLEMRYNMNDQMIEKDKYYDALDAMTEEDRIRILDPICEAVLGKANVYDGVEVRANRIFALATLELYKNWQTEIWQRE